MAEAELTLLESPEAPTRAKHLQLRLPLSGALPDAVPARMINEVLYCERLFYLEWSQGEFRDNVFTVEGRFAHRRADHAGGSLPPKPEANAPEDDASAAPEAVPYTARSVWLTSERLGITAKIDVVEGEAAGRVVPIEYKRGAPPDVPEGAYLPERAQLCAQVLLLRDNGYACDEAAIYFAAARRRVAIVIDDALVAATMAAVARAREVALLGTIPPPLVDSPKCNGCSLVGICLPDETNLLRRLAGGELDEAEALADSPSPAEADGEVAIEEEEEEGALDADEPVGDEPEVAPARAVGLRRLHPARDDKVPLYVQEQGARIGLDGERLAVASRTGARTEVRLANTSQVALLGNVQISTQALRALLERGIPLSLFSYGGWYYGRATGMDSKNIELRIAQHRTAADPGRCLRLSRGFVVSKIRNSRTMLRRNHAAPDPVVLSQLEQLAKKAAAAGSLEELLGLEGSAAGTYFASFRGMMKGEAAALGTFDLETRNRRPPRDPINALLSFIYALLAKDFAIALGAVGLDPLLGFYHQPRFGRAALALDLMEEFRPIVADSAVVGAINNGVVAADDFSRVGDAVSLKPNARKRMVMAFERRMDQLVTHPVFGYRLSYRRVLEVQARLLGRVLLGELEDYPAFRTR